MKGVHLRHEVPPAADDDFIDSIEEPRFIIQPPPRWIGTVLGWFLIVILIGVTVIFLGYPSFGRDLDGRYANDALHGWFEQLASGKGLCCSFAEGVSIKDVDWDTRDGRYRVRLHGEWIFVPENALVTEPNRFGPAVVWPYLDSEGTTQIRCFLPGAGA